MRIGTWNLAGRWGEEHRALLESLECDVLLLTEVSERLKMPGYRLHLGRDTMAARRRWAAVLSASHELEPLPDPHVASAAAVVDGTTFVSAVLPWRSCGADPWGEGGHGPRAARTIDALLDHLPAGGFVLGGDWNHALSGQEHAGSKAGRSHLLAALERWDLLVPTATLAHRIPGLLGIDHVAVPRAWPVRNATRVVADVGGRRLSDHDACVVEVVVTPS